MSDDLGKPVGLRVSTNELRMSTNEAASTTFLQKARSADPNFAG